MRLVNRLYIGLLLTASAAFAQYPIPGSSGGGSGGGGCVAGTGITCVGSTISVDTAVIEPRAGAQSGASTYCRSTTGNDTYTCALTPTLTAYTSGGCVVLFADTANTLAATLNVDALGAVSILTRTGGALSTGDVPAKPITLCHDGTNYIIQGDGGGSGGSGTVTDVTCGTGLTGGVINVSGTCAIDTAVVPEKAAANTFAELQTLQKGANIASSTALASAGDIRYNGGDIQYRDGSGSITLMKNPFTTRGDMLVQGASGPARLAAGTSGYFLMANGAAADPSYQIPNASQVTNAFDKSTTNSLGANYFDMTEQAAPSAPGANVARVYSKDDAGTTKVCYKDSSGTETCLSAGGGGSPGGSSGQPQYNDGAGGFSGLGYLQDGANFRIKWDAGNGVVALRNNADSAYLTAWMDGLVLGSSGNISLSTNGVFISSGAFFGPTGFYGEALVFPNDEGMAFSSTGSAGGALDSGVRRADAGNVKITDGASGLGKIVVSQTTPSASSDACTAGAIWADATYIYACTASGTIKRAALTTF